MAIISPNTVDLIHAVVRGHLDQDVRTSTIKALSGIEYNVLQVAIDHMIEHQEHALWCYYQGEVDLTFYDAAAIDETYSDEERDDICKRLQAAKKLKALFS